jgi:hypothetical protein
LFLTLNKSYERRSVELQKTCRCEG